LQDALGVTDLDNKKGELVDLSGFLFDNPEGGELHAMVSEPRHYIYSPLHTILYYTLHTNTHVAGN
jgi:hypothetical protein|tara:strand:+ start:1300 stop:1497 length:198 start_codon:yes stop_codon:yes gene_type:complete